MKSCKMTNEQRALLRRHAEHFQAMASYIRECHSEELAELEAACAAVSSTNISWDCYRAAKFLAEEIEIRREMERRATERETALHKRSRANA